MSKMQSTPVTLLLVAGRVWGHHIKTTEPKSVPLRELESAPLQEIQVVKPGKCWLFVKLALLHLCIDWKKIELFVAPTRHLRVSLKLGFIWLNCVRGAVPSRSPMLRLLPRQAETWHRLQKFTLASVKLHSLWHPVVTWVGIIEFPDSLAPRNNLNYAGFY